MIYPPLRRGMSNPAVASMKAGVRRALAAKGAKVFMKDNQKYGVLTVYDVRRYKRLYRVGNLVGGSFGAEAWKPLEADHKLLGDYDRQRIRSYNVAQAAAKEAALRAAHEVAMRAAIAGVALRFYAERANYVYRQYRPMASDLFSPAAYYRTDCSSSATLIYKAAGMPDPNGRGFDGYGYTGTMDGRSSLGTWTPSPKAGDLAFYGPGRSATTHVAVHISPDEIVSFGSTPVKRLPVRYRGDYVGSKTYL